ncbi:hypothetical protein TNCV_1564151 [Trichonephila clavipes]|nr:hypothetical protein TNCV_1564151 [Trichonephila clavipes]
MTVTPARAPQSFSLCSFFHSSKFLFQFRLTAPAREDCVLFTRTIGKTACFSRERLGRLRAFLENDWEDCVLFSRTIGKTACFSRERLDPTCISLNFQCSDSKRIIE